MITISTGSTHNDCEICIGVYYPLKHKVKNHRGYPIIVEDSDPDAFKGLRGRYRSCVLLKNRLGISDRLIPVNFFGEIGYFTQLPKPDTVTDWTPYLSLTPEAIETKDVSEVKADTTSIKFSL